MAIFVTQAEQMNYWKFLADDNTTTEGGATTETKDTFDWPEFLLQAKVILVIMVAVVAGYAMAWILYLLYLCSGSKKSKQKIVYKN